MRNKRLIFSACLLAMTAIGMAQAINTPGPGTEFVMQLRVTLGEAYVVGETPHGKRTVIPITGGTFEGPLLKGTILNGGADWQLAKGNHTELEAIYSIKTDDGVYIHIRNKGIIYGGKDEHGQDTFYFRAAPQFEAPEDSRYAWLNNALFVCAPVPGQHSGITLNVWKVKGNGTPSQGGANGAKRSSCASGPQVENPMLWADVPDPDIIRVGDTFYLVSTTMHLMPGAPIMKSKDLRNWETVGYVFDKLTDSPKYDLQNGTAYGRGQWATSLKYHNGKFYALLAPNEQGAMGDTYIFSAEKAEGPWKQVSRMRHFHDCSLFFDDDNRVYVIYGTGEMMELKPDLSDVIEGTHQQIFQREADETGLLEGSRMIKHNGKYYLLMISHVYAPGRHRREVCYRADDIHGPYEKNVILESEFGGFSYEAQGTIVDSEDGDWYGVIFQDRGGVGRVLTLMPCRWIDGWPMLGDENGLVPATVRPVKSGEPETTIVKADDFSSSNALGLHWQWNHNPVNEAWSLTERPGYLRLKTSRVVPNLYLAPNTLTQRMEGPACSGSIVMDVSKMKDGDCAGFSAFNSDSGVLTVKKKGKTLTLEMSEQSVTLSDRDKIVEKVEEKVIESIPLAQASKIWLRIDGDFQPSSNSGFGGKDAANFFYSLDGTEWKQIGTKDYKMRFDWRRFFMGSKFGIFCYATKGKGGYVDIDTFDYIRK